MPTVRVIKRRDGTMQVQQRDDERYDDATLPRGTTRADVVAEVVVDAAALDGVRDVEQHLDLVDGQLVKDTRRRTLHERRVRRRAAALETLARLEGDDDVPAAVKRYLVAVRTLLDPDGGTDASR
jgi:hypothetical protein